MVIKTFLIEKGLQFETRLCDHWSRSISVLALPEVRGLQCLQNLEALSQAVLVSSCAHACGLLAQRQSGLVSYLIAPPGTNVTHGKCLAPPTCQKIVTKLVCLPPPTIAPADLAYSGKLAFRTQLGIYTLTPERQVFGIYLSYYRPLLSLLVISVLIYYRMIRRGRHLTSSPTNNTHTQPIASRLLYTVY
jgi:hypothetical protein